MKKFLLLIIFISLSMTLPLFASNAVELLPVEVDIHDQASLQRGARIYMNYCSGCHSLKYMRYNRMAEDLGLITFDGAINEKLLVSNLIFTSAKIQDPIEISLPAVDARQWFGIVPPDLSLSARKRSADWLYTYLKSFYVDKSRPFGSNNLLIPGVAMPNVLAPLSGKVVAMNNTGDHLPTPSQLQRVKKGEMSEQEFDNALQDLVTFLVYVGEPVKLTRYHTGWLVLVFLGIFLIVVYRLKKIYWKMWYSRKDI